MLSGLPQSDTMIFSLSPASSTITDGTIFPNLGRAFSPADLFITDFDGKFALWATSESLGLLTADNVDALDVLPEPATAAVLATLLLASTHRRRPRSA